MNIRMAGIDYSIADIDLRERFSFTKKHLEDIYSELKKIKGVLGSVIISTCNRTEIYLSCEDDFDVNPFFLLCKTISSNYFDYEDKHNALYGDEAINHLCLLACGTKSQIWGEDQIITQVKEAIAFAREQEATDSIIEVLFRTGVTCAKKVKTEIKLTQKETSIADKLINKLSQYKNIKSVLVIGNGEIGRLTAEKLIINGYNVTMTVRQYKHNIVKIPDGVIGLEYDERYQEITNFDCVVSATLSPHYTVTKDKILAINNYPKLYFDLAVPRDIEKSIRNITDVELYDVDDLKDGEESDMHEKQLEEINVYVDKYRLDFYKWESFRKELLIMQ